VVADVRAGVGSILVQNHLDDIESEGDVWHVEHAKPGHGPTKDELTFFPVNGLVGVTELVAAPGLDFDEDEFVAVFVTADDVHLAAMGGAEIAPEDLVPVGFEVADSHILAPASQREVRTFFIALAQEPVSEPGQLQEDGGHDEGGLPVVFKGGLAVSR